jgi:DeoR/GlpR family transcriptional regulator of sugar metabolism
VFVEEKKRLVYTILEEQNAVTVQDLSDKLSLSAVSVRKLLNEMAEEGFLHRTRGGAVRRDLILNEVSQKEKEGLNISEKADIAAEAFRLLKNGDTVFLDAGSTTLALAKLIRTSQLKNITVFTNALNIAMELLENKNINMIVTGGEVRHDIMSCVGEIAGTVLSHFVINKVFIGSNSVSLEKGVTTLNLHEAQMKQRAIACAKHSYLLCDYSKFNKSATVVVAELKSFDAVITDHNMPHKEKTKYTGAGVKLVIAEQRKDSGVAF